MTNGAFMLIQAACFGVLVWAGWALGSTVVLGVMVTNTWAIHRRLQSARRHREFMAQVEDTMRRFRA